MSETRYAICPICECHCGLRVTIENNRPVRIRGEAGDPHSAGYLCPKGVALRDLHHDPDRVRQPLRRSADGEGWEPISWALAHAEVTERLTELQRRHGRNAVALYVGNPLVHDYASALSLPLLMGALRTRNYYTANSLDALPRLLAARMIYGSALMLTAPDLDRTAMLLVMGANPVVSNGSLMTAPDFTRRVKALQARGGKLVVVDPRRSETAALADGYLAIRPGTDALLLLAMLECLVADGALAPGALAPRLEGLAELEALVARFPAQRVAQAVGLDADAIRSLARDFAAAPRAVCYGRLGTCVQAFGTLTSCLIELLNLLTGNVDRPGGAMLPLPAVDLTGWALRLGVGGWFERWRSRVEGLPEFNGELPITTLAEEISTPGPDQVRGLICVAGNPVLSAPGGRRLAKAVAGLDFMVSLGPYIDETSCHADLILPPSMGLENDQYPLFGDAFAVRNTARFAPAQLTAPEGVRPDAAILRELATGLIARQGRLGGWVGTALGPLLERLEPKNLLDWLIRLGPRGLSFSSAGGGLSLSRLAAAAPGVDFGELTPRLGKLIGAKGIMLLPSRLLPEVARLERELLGEAAGEGSAEGAGTAEDAEADGQLLLIGRRQRWSFNSWTHNLERLVGGQRISTLLMHPGDAEARGLVDGERVRIHSPSGAVETELEVSDELRPGVVSLPHGWGHDRPGAQLSVASAHPGVNPNDLIDPRFRDGLSGTAALFGAPVRVSKL